jgi:hypothetical protein
MSEPTSAPAGTVCELWRYPVKSLQGEPVDRLVLTADPDGSGVVGDRAWGIVDRGTGHVLSAKTVPALLHAVASSSAEGTGAVAITLPDGTALTSDDRVACDRALSAWLGRDVGLRPAAARAEAEGAAGSFQMTFDPPDDDAELVELDMPPGSFVDLAGVHVLTTGSLATMAVARPDGDWAPRRFRPNVLVDTGAATGHPEDAWVGGRLGVGPATLEVGMRTVRCAMPLRAQPALGDRPALARDVEVYRTMAQRHDNHLGAYAEVVVAGTVSLGDPVTAPAT